MVALSGLAGSQYISVNERLKAVRALASLLPRLDASEALQSLTGIHTVLEVREEALRAIAAGAS